MADKAVREKTMSRALEEVFADARGKPCLRVPDGKVWTYGDIDILARKMLAVLISFDLTAGDRVLVQTEKSVESVAFYLSCLRLGCIYIPINTAYTKAEVDYFIEDAAPSLFICQIEREKDFQSLSKALSLLTLGSDGEGSLMQKVKNSEPAERESDSSPDDVAAILYTSGTTGRSKGAMITQKNLLTNASALVDIWSWGPEDTLLHALPIFHVHGLFVALHCVFLSHASAIFLRRFDPALVSDLLSRSSVSVMMGVPTFYARLLQNSNLGAKLSNRIRLFISGSAPLTEADFSAWERETGYKILERYGMTETGMITSNPVDGERIAGTVGFALPGVEVRISDDAGKLVANGEIGVIEVRGPNVFKGYWGMPAKTSEEFRSDGFFITGDLALMGEDGRVTIVGRGKDLIISGGYNVYPKEVESLIDGLNGVKETAVIGVKHADFGEGVVAVVVPEQLDIELEFVSRSLKAKLANFKIPKAIVNVSELPRNVMGKVQKNILRERFHDLFDRD